MHQLYVQYEAELVGIVSIDVEGIFSFQYDSHWLQSPHKFPLSISIPLCNEQYGHRSTLAFFENLLPEGELRYKIEHSRGIEGVEALLNNYGKDCAGAITVTATPLSAQKISDEVVEIPFNKIEKALAEHHSLAQMIAIIEPGYLSLAGAQDKFPAIYRDGHFLLPKNMGPTTHIIKAPIWRSGVKESVYNEYYCMKLAKLVGLSVPNFFIHPGKHPLFVIERYDRKIKNNQKYYRIHQQDFCQAMGFPSNQKYEDQGGPSIIDNFQLIKKYVSPHHRLHDLNAFLTWICFNLLIGNNDSHSKNISLLMDEKIHLAPFYDLLCTEIYPGLKKRFSFKIDGRDTPDKISKKHLANLNEQLELRSRTFEDILLKTIEVLEVHYALVSSEVQDEFKDCNVTVRINELIRKRIKNFKSKI